MSILPWKSSSIPARVLRTMTLPALLATVLAIPDWCMAQETSRPHLPPDSCKAARIEEVDTRPDLAHDSCCSRPPQLQCADGRCIAAPARQEGIWVLNFSFKPLRIKTVEIPGKGRRNIHYLYYKVVNRTGSPRMFVPQFIMVNEDGKKFEDQVIPQAVPPIQAREDRTIPVLGAVNIMGVIPASTKPNVDDAVYGVAVWDQLGPQGRPFQYLCARTIGRLQGSARTQRRQANRQVQDLTHRLHPSGRRPECEREENIEFNDPPYEWVYW